MTYTNTDPVISYGGGVQSTALLVLASTGKINASVALFANVGDDSETPGTIEYVRTVAAPWAQSRGVEVVEVERSPWPNGDPKTLLSYMRAYNGCQACGVGPDDECEPGCPSTKNTGGDLPIPMKIEPSGAPVRRSCTNHWKIGPIEQWVAAHGATKDNPTPIMLGISTDEIERARTGHRAASLTSAVYPLLDLRLSRSDCASIIMDAGLPVPTKSTCWFCPFWRPSALAERRRDAPALFYEQADLEDGLNEQRARRGLSPVFFTSTHRPLRELAEAQTPLFAEDPDGCESGYCWT